MKKLMSLTTGINIVLVVIALNVLLTFLPKVQLDLTQNKIYSLSPASQKIIKELKDVVNIKVYVTADLPPEVKPVSRNLKTILDGLQKINPSKFRVTYYDPQKDEAAMKEANKYGIKALQFSSVKSDKFEVQTGYFGLAMVYGNKQEVMPVAGDIGNLEYFMVSGVKRLINPQLPTIAISDESSATQYLHKYLEKEYTVVNATLNGDSKLPEAASTLIIIGPENKVDTKGVKKIEDWLASGKGLIMFTNQVVVDQTMQGQIRSETGLEKILEKYGMSIENKLVADDSSVIANFRTDGGTFLVRYPYWVQVRPENIDGSWPFMSGITSLIMPWVSPIKVTGDAKPIFTSSQNSVANENLTNLSPTNKNSLSGNKGKSTLGAINTSGVKLIFIADTDFINDQYIANSQQNLVTVLNMVDYLGQDQSLLSIRNKSIKDNPIAQVDEKTKTIIRVIEISIPILTAIVTFVIVTIVFRKKNEKWNRN